MLQVGEILHGFRVLSRREIPDVEGTLYEAEYEKNGARLLYLDRADTNMTFAITFKTVPEDSTGVFHIIEHSVLCGSEKYPVKEPFVNLLKSSLQTFLNAMTAWDHTMYPVSSRCHRDFLNLIDVYMDAVLHPALLQRPEIFRQEGWHYEPAEDGSLSYKGVVFNEMKGAYSSEDEVAAEALTRLLYPDTCYSHDSGGDPTVIPTLTYEAVCEAHRRFYTPSNACLFLDGSVDLDATLSLLDGYLAPYGRTECHFDIPDQPGRGRVCRTASYEIAPGESGKDKTNVYLGFLGSRFDDRLRNAALSVIAYAIADSNSAPLPRAIVGDGLAESVELEVHSTECLRGYLSLEMKHVPDGRVTAAKRRAMSTLRRLVRQGIDRAALEASLDRMEFNTREADFGNYPRGLIYLFNVMDSYLYGGDPAAPLTYSDLFPALRERLGTGYYEQVLQEAIFGAGTTASLTMRPSATLGKRRLRAERARLRAARRAMSEEEYRQLCEQHQALLSWQQTEDSAEALATLPCLTREDLPREIATVDTERGCVGGVTTLYHPLPTNGILYTSLYFDASDLTAEEASLLAAYTSTFSCWCVGEGTAQQLRCRLKAESGSLSLLPVTVTDRQSGEARLYLALHASALQSRQGTLLSLLSDVLLLAHPESGSAVRERLMQLRTAQTMLPREAGHAYAIRRAGAYINREAALRDAISGEAYRRYLTHLCEQYDAQGEDFLSRGAALLHRLAVRGRATVSLTASCEDGALSGLVGLLPTGERCPMSASAVAPLGCLNEGLLVPAQIGFAAMMADLRALGCQRLPGAMDVAQMILRYEYLWQSIRVQGGAYGAGMLCTADTLGFYSYRDPDPAHSVEVYRRAAAFLRQFAAHRTDLTSFLVAAVGEDDPLQTPFAAGMAADMRILRGVTDAERRQRRAEMMAVTHEELLQMADLLEAAAAQDAVVVVGGQDKLQACAGVLRQTVRIG